uniref:Polyprenyl synthetase n=1 Tax=Biomphalaria glabrata TaxID=6526 RepID=A0A2C9L5R6_BIOGL
MCGCNRDMYIKLAVAVESLHNATLLHDDVVDGAEMRRSKETMTSEGDLVKGGESYFDVIISKTATLFAAACDSVAVIANGNDEMRSAFKNFGLNLGIAFQIKDDVLDYISGSTLTGKIS